MDICAHSYLLTSSGVNKICSEGGTTTVLAIGINCVKQNAAGSVSDIEAKCLVVAKTTVLKCQALATELHSVLIARIKYSLLGI